MYNLLKCKTPKLSSIEYLDLGSVYLSVNRIFVLAVRMRHDVL